ncbi:Plant self-incompatibility S1 [Arabidopsis suecica]|uniref:S-protein homolog n=1 Tax=Arabidopsis suecica TaxID=45249 RepID=A0A8T2BLW6_ARASU|nr:Plant self-incompatibility S1 [Arabidopsis suecica]
MTFASSSTAFCFRSVLLPEIPALPLFIRCDGDIVGEEEAEVPGLRAAIDGVNKGQKAMFCENSILAFRNELTPGSILKVNCTSKNNNIVRDVRFQETTEWKFNENPFKRTIWKCLLRQGPKMENQHTLWRAYRGGSTRRCGQIRRWIAKTDGVYLEGNLAPRKRMYDWYKV